MRRTRNSGPTIDTARAPGPRLPADRAWAAGEGEKGDGYVEPANLLLIMADEHNPAFLGCSGDSVVKTPNLDALAARGTRFANAYCNSPICVPSRASFATGRYVHEIGAWDTSTPYTGAEAASWGRRLTDRGHGVTTVGKLHFRKADDPTGFADQRLPMHALDGAGDVLMLLRGDVRVERPTHPRERILEAGAGESEYTRYDRAVARTAADWLREKAHGHAKPWALFVSFASPHYPLIVPEEYADLYPPQDLPLPAQHSPEEWPRHPAVELHRRLAGLDEPFEEAVSRRAIAAYHGLVTFLDEQVGAVLDALEDAGLRERTRVLFTSDHGDLAGGHGLWYKSSMYEGSVGVPMLAAGPGVPEGRVCKTNISLVDCFPSIVEAVGAEPAPEDADLPGESLWRLAKEEERERIAFSEYHAAYSASGTYMVRDARRKYVYYVGSRPQLFDLDDDPDEVRDLAEDPRSSGVQAYYERELRSIVDPEGADLRAKADQRRRIDAFGGPDAIARRAASVSHTPAPSTEMPDPPPGTRLRASEPRRHARGRLGGNGPWQG